jgi:RNA polymerase sigma factor (TIGR02999 family)
MVTPSPDEVARHLAAWNADAQSALDHLVPVVHAELHRLALQYMRRERPGHSLQTTALVNETYLRLIGYSRMQWKGREHFFAVSAQVMRRILVEHARRPSAGPHSRWRGTRRRSVRSSSSSQHRTS